MGRNPYPSSISKVRPFLPNNSPKELSRDLPNNVFSSHRITPSRSARIWPLPKSMRRRVRCGCGNTTGWMTAAALSILCWSMDKFMAGWRKVSVRPCGKVTSMMKTGTLMDYAIPKAHQFPWFETETMETKTPINPLGAKGVGEAGTIGSTPAIVNSVVDALSRLGVRHIDMPLKPEKIWQILKQESAVRHLEGASDDSRAV